MNVGDLLGRERVFVGNQSTSRVAAPAVSSNVGAQHEELATSCFGCEIPHVVKFCPERKRVEIKC